MRDAVPATVVYIGELMGMRLQPSCVGRSSHRSPGNTPAANAPDVSPSATVQPAAPAADAATRHALRFPFLGPGRVSATIALIQASTLHRLLEAGSLLPLEARTPAL